jgi:hypothetical protein
LSEDIVLTLAAGVASSLVPFGCETTQHSSNYQFVVIVVVTKVAFRSRTAAVPVVGRTD